MNKEIEFVMSNVNTILDSLATLPRIRNINVRSVLDLAGLPDEYADYYQGYYIEYGDEKGVVTEKHRNDAIETFESLVYNYFEEQDFFDDNDEEIDEEDHEVMIPPEVEQYAETMAHDIHVAIALVGAVLLQLGVTDKINISALLWLMEAPDEFIQSMEGNYIAFDDKWHENYKNLTGTDLREQRPPSTVLH